MRLPLALALTAGLAMGCAGVSPRRTTPAVPARLLPAEEPYFADLRQLTFEGENAEAYWSFDGQSLSLQARHEGEGCDRIYRLRVDDASPRLEPVSSGHGATTCAHFLPGGDLIFASTHLGGRACPPRPDMTRGYVWALYDSYDIFRAPPKGTPLRPLTTTPGYDAEGTVCGRDGSILFTSTRDGDLELYRMDADGGNVRRLTRTPGYDGGAFFNADCSKIVWRASRPRPGRELDEYRALLTRGLVRPSKLEIWVADADGAHPMQITYLDAASFAPAFHPAGDWIVFSSNVGDPRGREFDLWAVRPNGSGLTRLTHTPGFDGFPHFAPDGRRMAFSSNRATAPGSRDTNVFIARWKGVPPSEPRTAADRIARDVAWLADPARQGRGLATQGLPAAGAYLEERLRSLGVAPGAGQSYRHTFPVVTQVQMAPASHLEIDGRPVATGDLSVLGFSAEGRVAAPMVLAGYGIVDERIGIDDYAGRDVRGKVVLVRRFAPETKALSDPGTRNRLGDLRRKAFAARERGARALVIVDWPLPPDAAPAGWTPPGEAALLKPSPDGGADAGLPVMMIKREALAAAGRALEEGRPVPVSLEVALTRNRTEAFNVVGRIPAGRTPSTGTVIIGAHYDHLGLGGATSLTPGRQEPHLGADDNASGTAALLELARALQAGRDRLSRDVLVMFFSGEESGLLGSTHYTRSHTDTLSRTMAMINLDMVGRLRHNRVEVLGGQTAAEWGPLVEAACTAERVSCVAAGTGDGFGASDQAAFYAAGIPVLHFFTGTHEDYHKPTDTAAKINAAGAAAIARVIEHLAIALQAQPRLTFRKGVPGPARGDARSFGASLGTIPDYAGPPHGAPGVLLAGVRPGGAADRAGMRRGDVLIRLGTSEIRSVQDLGFALGGARPGQTVTAVVLRAGQRLELPTTFQEARGIR